ncbi:S26 family signal peptidase [Phenylobacterium sp.]|jgi:conjugative transfer signal peptidase TraF|uniref:S26 family signal peptidase n=1 Tax=Phenylobacterium sp. TaxID=1871053 RepID=UPI003BA84271
MTPAAALTLLAAVIPTAGAAVAHEGPARPWIVNETPSMPRGLYRAIAAFPERGAVVALSPPPSARAYLRRLGARDDALLLKRVVAGAGARACMSGQVLTWPSGSAIALDTDRQGRRLKPWQGCRRLEADELLVIGDSAASFDSRYFGPIRRSSIHGVYREVFRW